jgi:hypothetical protein
MCRCVDSTIISVWKEDFQTLEPRVLVSSDLDTPTMGIVTGLYFGITSEIVTSHACFSAALVSNELVVLFEPDSDSFDTMVQVVFSTPNLNAVREAFLQPFDFEVADRVCSMQAGCQCELKQVG